MRKLTDEEEMILTMKDLGFEFKYRKGQTVWVTLGGTHLKGIIVGTTGIPIQKFFSVRLCSQNTILFFRHDELLPVRLSDVR